MPDPDATRPRPPPRRHIPAEGFLALTIRAEELEAIGMKLVQIGTRAPLVRTRSKGPQLSPKFSAGLKLLEAANDIWERLYRLAPEEPKAPNPKASLDAFRRARHRA